MEISHRMPFLTLALLPFNRGLAPQLYLRPEAAEAAPGRSADLRYFYGHNMDTIYCRRLPAPYTLHDVLERRLSASRLLSPLCMGNPEQTIPYH